MSVAPVVAGTHRRLLIGAPPEAAEDGAIPVDLRDAGGAAGLAIAAHGRNGAPGQAHMAAVVRALLRRGIAVAAPHFRHSVASEAGGAPEGFTMAGAVAELGRVLDAVGRDLPAAPGGALLAGHSMGAYAALRLAAERPGEVRAVLALSPVTSGAALIEARRAEPGALAALARELPHAAAEWPGHDLAPLAALIRVPVAIVTGADDHLTRAAAVSAFARLLPRSVSVEVLEGQPHCPSGPAWDAALDRALARLAA